MDDKQFFFHPFDISHSFSHIDVYKRQVNALCDPALDEEVCAERAFLQELNGGCHTPLGARCILHDTTVELYAVYGNEDGTRLKQLHVSGAREQAVELAIQAAAVLREQVGGKQ